MANKNLTTNYLSRLSNANHDGVTQQISDRLADFETDNQMLTAAPARHPVVQAASRPAVAHPTMAAARHRAPARMMAATTLDNP